MKSSKKQKNEQYEQHSKIVAIVELALAHRRDNHVHTGINSFLGRVE